MMRCPRPVYIVLRVFEALGQVASRFINAAFLGGSTRQSVSARAHLEWPVAERQIDAFFRHLPLWWEDNHCANSWASEVSDALKTLERNKRLEKT